MRVPILTLLMVIAIENALCQPFTYPTEVKPVIKKMLTYPTYKPKNLVKDTLAIKNYHQGFKYKENVKSVPQKPQK